MEWILVVFFRTVANEQICVTMHSNGTTVVITALSLSEKLNEVSVILFWCMKPRLPSQMASGRTVCERRTCQRELFHLCHYKKLSSSEKRSTCRPRMADSISTQNKTKSTSTCWTSTQSVKHVKCSLRSTSASTRECRQFCLICNDQIRQEMWSSVCFPENDRVPIVWKLWLLCWLCT